MLAALSPAERKICVENWPIRKATAQTTMDRAIAQGEFMKNKIAVAAPVIGAGGRGPILGLRLSLDAEEGGARDRSVPGRHRQRDNAQPALTGGRRLAQKSSGALSVTSFMTKKVRVWRMPGSAMSRVSTSAES